MTTETAWAPEALAPDATPVAWRDRADDQLARPKACLAAINAQLASLATKADVERAINVLTWRLILGSVALAGVLMAAIAAAAAWIKLF